MSLVIPIVICLAVTPGPGTGAGPLAVGVGVRAGLRDGDASSPSPAELAQAAVTMAVVRRSPGRESCANLTTYVIVCGDTPLDNHADAYQPLLVAIESRKPLGLS